MKYILCLLPLAATAFAKSSAVTEAQAEDPVLGTETVHGCYSSVGSLTLNGTSEFNTEGSCATACSGGGFAVAASQEMDCYCGAEYPAENTLVDDAECNELCPGYPNESCGGTDAYTVYNTGLVLHVASSDDDSSSSSASSASASASATASSNTSTAATAIATASGAASNSTGSATGTSATTSSTAVVGISGASAQLPIVGLNMAVLGLGAALLM
ncbi:YmL10 [Pestalotiopsis sp. IQ-011]